MKNAIIKSNVTIQAPRPLLEKVGEVAKSLGRTRMKDGQEVPELGQTIADMIRFALTDPDRFYKFILPPMKK